MSEVPLYGERPVVSKILTLQKAEGNEERENASGGLSFSHSRARARSLSLSLSLTHPPSLSVSLNPSAPRSPGCARGLPIP